MLVLEQYHRLKKTWYIPLTFLKIFSWEDWMLEKRDNILPFLSSGLVADFS